MKQKGGVVDLAIRVNKRLRINKIIALFIVVIFNISCSSTKNLTHKSVEYQLSQENKMKFRYSFFEGNRYFLQGDYDNAESAFNACLVIDSTSAATYYKLASIYLYRKDYNTAENYAKKAVIYNNKNLWYKYLLGNLYSNNNKYNEAAEIFKSLIKTDTKKLDFYLSLADIYLKKGDTKAALKTLNNIEKNFGISEMVTLQKHKIYLSIHDYKNALQVLKNLEEKYPKNGEYKKLIAEFYLKINKIQEAKDKYNEVLQLDIYDGYARLGLAECEFKLGEYQLAANQLKKAFNNDDIPSDVKISLLVNLLQNIKDNEELKTIVYELTEILVKKYPKNPDVNTIYADFLLKNNLLKEAKVYLRKVIAVRKDKYMVWEQLLLLENEFKNWKDLYNESTEALNYFPNQSFLYFFNGFSAFQLGKYEDAIKSLNFGYKLITKDDPLRLDYMTFIAECNYKLGNKEEAYKMFDLQLKSDSNNIMVLNNYAYYLSLDNQELDKALEMSQKTIDKEPSNATYLDTYAWILFKLKEYKKALKYIEKTISLDLDPSDVVLEHYGDILYFNANKKDAINQWKKAKEKGEGSGLLDKKINKGEYVK